MTNIYLKEKIGNPALFTGRKQELRFFLNWIQRIKPEISKSTALLSRRKTGKTAILQRLYNLTFEANDGVIPFYYELREGKKWAVEFAEDFYLSFMFQYIAFKTRDPRYIDLSQRVIKRFEDAKQGAAQINADLVKHISDMEELIASQKANLIWQAARETPWTLAAVRDERIVQIIDEFQFLNSEIYWDEAQTNHADDFAAGYMSTAEYRNAPLLVSGSWVGWLMHDLQTMLPGRFKTHHLKNLPEDEALEMIYRYSFLDDIPLTEEAAYLMVGLTEGNPFYISSLFRSSYPDRDLTTATGVLKTLEFETLDSDGEMRGTWLEYIEAALPRINEKHAKDIVLYLSKNRDRAMSYQTIKQELQIDLPDYEIRKKMKALLQNDIIEQYSALYRGVQDNIFDKIFRSEYGEDIEQFTTEGAQQEYQALYARLKKEYNSLLGEHNRYKGMYAEFLITQHLRIAHQNPDYYNSLFKNLSDGFRFVPYQRVWAYHSPPLHEPGFQIDIFAQADETALALIGEVKHRQAKFTLDETHAFERKVFDLCQLEQIVTYQRFVFCSGGFHKKVLDYFRAHNIAWSDDVSWLKTLN